MNVIARKFAQTSGKVATVARPISLRLVEKVGRILSEQDDSFEQITATEYTYDVDNPQDLGMRGMSLIMISHLFTLVVMISFAVLVGMVGVPLTSIFAPLAIATMCVLALIQIDVVNMMDEINVDWANAPDGVKV